MCKHKGGAATLIKILTLSGGILGAAGASQFPEFSQQYTQRLAGQVDALTQVVEDFDATALRSDLTRTQALEQMVGTAFIEDRQTDMRRTFARHAVLSDHLVELRQASGMARLTMPHRHMDSKTIAQTWGDFVPAAPLTLAGAVSALIGFVAGSALIAAIVGILKLPFRKRSTRHPDVSPANGA